MLGRPSDQEFELEFALGFGPDRMALGMVLPDPFLIGAQGPERLPAERIAPVDTAKLKK